jgi:hypothetical protein
MHCRDILRNSEAGVLIGTPVKGIPFSPALYVLYFRKVSIEAIEEY